MINKKAYVFPSWLLIVLLIIIVIVIVAAFLLGPYNESLSSFVQTNIIEKLGS